MPEAGHSPDPAAPASAKNRMLAGAAPAGRQFLVNLKVWAPYFSNRIDRDRLVRFSALDYRVGLKWTAALPKQCWACGAEEPLAATEFKRVLRAYENPLAILAGTAAGGLIGLLILLFAPGIGTLLLLALILAVGLGLLKLKSWDEDVRLAVWSCREHGAELAMPEMCIDDQQLCVFAPTVELAETARASIREKRKRGLKPYEGAVAPPEEESSPARSRRPAATVAESAPSSYTPPPPAELPPIRLAGEEDDAPAA